MTRRILSLLIAVYCFLLTNESYSQTGDPTPDSWEDVSSSVVTTQNVGIGLNNPQTLFHVHKSTPLGAIKDNNQLISRISGVVPQTFQQSVWLLRESNTAHWSAARIHNGISINNSYQSPGINSRVWWERDPGFHTQAWGDQQKTEMVLKYGKLGIGTTSPKARLHSHEEAHLGGAHNNNRLLQTVSGLCPQTFEKNLWLRREGNSSHWTNTRLHDGISINSSYQAPGVNSRVWWERDPGNHLQAWGDQQSTEMVLRNGKLGIGTSSPDGKLEVVGAGLNQRITGFSNANSGVFIAAPLVQAGYNYHAQAGDVGLIWTDKVSQNTFNQSSGLVIAPHSSSHAGIRLDADGGVRIGGHSNLLPQEAGLVIYDGSGVGVGHTKNLELIIGSDQDTAIVVSNYFQSAEKFKVMGSGLVYAREVKVQYPPFPDYVFEDSYDLLTIQEVSSFIQKNHHLPGIPSSQEVKESEIGVGELQTRLLQKIEELTLYVIQLEKKIQEIEKK